MILMSVSDLFKFHLTSVPPKAGEHIYKLCYDCVNSAPPNCTLKVRLSPILGIQNSLFLQIQHSSSKVTQLMVIRVLFWRQKG